jgi:glutamyl-tRNA synthetase
MGIGVLPLPAEMRDFVVRKKDGFPAYQLSSLVDDLHYGVDLIVRGQDLWASTMAQYYLANFLDGGDFGADAGDFRTDAADFRSDGERFRAAHFYHHSLLTADGEKLSKSAGATSIRYLRQHGLTRGEIYALIAGSLESGNTATAGSGAGAAARQSAHSTPVSNWEELAALVEIRASRLQG